VNSSTSLPMVYSGAYVLLPVGKPLLHRPEVRRLAPDRFSGVCQGTAPSGMGNKVV